MFFSGRQVPLNILRINSPLPPIKIKSGKTAWFDLWFFGGWVPFPFYSVQDCSLPLPVNEIHPREQRDSGAKLFKKTTWWPSRLEPEPYKLKIQGITSWPGYLMIQSRLQHLFQIVRWDYWDTKGWRQLITIWYSTNCKAVMREKPCALLKQCKICAKTKMSLLPKGKSWSSWPQGTTSMLPCNCFDLVCITYLWLLIIHGFFLYHIAVNEDSVSTRVGHMIKTKVNEVSFYLQLNLFKCRRQTV